MIGKPEIAQILVQSTFGNNFISFKLVATNRYASQSGPVYVSAR